MLLRVQWDGSNLPFEGERAIPVRTLPEGARVVSARVKVTPVDPGQSFLERIDLTVPQPAWGANKVVGANFVEVDFRARRTLAAVAGSHLDGATLQIDPGGAYVEINDQGAIASPGQPRFAFALAGGGVLPSFLATRFKFTRAALGQVNLSRVDIRSVPENVSLRLGGQPVFHTFLGPMTGPGESIDFANLLEEFLQTARVGNGFFDFELVVHSDTIARLKIDAELDVQIEHKALETGVGESVLDFAFDAIPAGAASSFQFDLPANAEAVAGRTAIRFQGAFDDSRIALGPLAPELTGQEVELHPAAGRAQAQAQPFTVPANLNITGIDLLLKPKDERTEVRVDIRNDLGGKPGLDSLLPAPLPVALLRDPSQAPHWVTVPLARELSLIAGQLLWLVVQSALNESAWAVVAPGADGPGLQSTRDGALSWRASQASGEPPLEALFRLRHKPPAFTMPIHVFAGEGEARQEVSLARYEPLGRVDFTLDTEEFAAAITNGIQRSAAVAGLPVEHITNGELESWFRTGDEPQSPRGFATAADAEDSFRAQAIALSPAGDVAYLVAIQGRQPVVRRMDPFCGSLIDTVTLSAAPGEGALLPAVAVSTSGRRLFIAAGNLVWAADTDAMEELGSLALAGDVNIVAAASSSGRLHFLSASLAGVAPSRRTISIADADLETSIQDGSQPAQTPGPATPDAIAIAVSQDGQTVALLARIGDTPAGRLDVVSAGGAAAASVPLTFSPHGLALSADGKTAYAGSTEDSTVRRIDVARRAVNDGPSMGVIPAALSLAALDGHRVSALESIALSPNGAAPAPRFTVLDFGTPLPEAWTITAGSFRPACLPAPFHVVGVLGGRGSERQLSPMSSVSQAAPASADQLYEFSFWGTASADGAVGEIIWRGSDCASPETTRVPIAVRPSKVQSAAASVALQLHRVRIQSPAGVTQAEVRFRATEGVTAVIDRISLHPADSPLANADFLERGDEAATTSVPAGWTLTPPDAPGFLAANGRIENNGANPAILTQEVTLESGTPFRLEFSGEVQANAEPPVAAVHWLDAEAAPVELTLEGSGVLAAAGAAPDLPGRAEVSLLLPGGSALQVDHFALRTGLTAGVPIEVFAETRGELTISQFQVVTNEAPPRPPAAPPEGLCPPTRPGAEEGEDCNYCPCCGHDEAPAPSATPSVSICRECGAGRPSAAVASTAVASIPPLPRLVTTARVVNRAGRAFAVSAVRSANTNIGETGGGNTAGTAGIRDHLSTVSLEESRNLAAAGITTLEQLAAAEPEDIVDRLPSGSLARARMLIGLAARRLEE